MAKNSLKPAANYRFRYALPAASLLALVLAPSLAAEAAQAPESKPHPQSCTLVINATGFRTDRGKAGAAVYSSPKGWPSHNDYAFCGGEIPISHGKATFKFQVPPGVYAIAVIDDVNENKKLDRNWLGIPTEGFGFANNPRVFLKAPSFKAASIYVKCPRTETTVHLKYR